VVNPDATERRQRDDEFVALLTQHRSPLLRYILSLIHIMPDAEDVFQQTAITLWDRFDEYRSGSDFFAWATTIAKYKTLNYFQTTGRDRLQFSESVIEQLATHDQWSTDFHQSRLNALAACRQKLSAADQKLLADCYGGQVCYGGDEKILDVAKRMGRPVGSVYNSLTRIRRALYACIQRTLASEGVR
jgi:RNA polymerase sigma-70 factor (ECF subfamily)